MMSTQSKVTAQGQISVPALVRQKLGLGPGSVLEWEERDGEFFVRRAGRVSSTAIHELLFSDAAAGRSKPLNSKPLDAKQALRIAMRKRHARD